MLSVKRVSVRDKLRVRVGITVSVRVSVNRVRVRMGIVWMYDEK